MTHLARPAEPTLVRRIFETWSIEIPASFAETRLDDGISWHAHDERRSVSLTSILVTDRSGPVGAAKIARDLPPLDGLPFDEMPDGLIGRAATGAAIQPARASSVLSGFLAQEGRLLIATITSDDLEWARRAWLSIRGHAAPAPPRPSRPERRARRAGHGKHRVA